MFSKINSLFFLILLVACSSDSKSPTEVIEEPIQTEIEGYRLVFHEAFNEIRLDTNKWNTHPWWGREHSGNGSVMYYADEAIRVQGGYLHIDVHRLEDQSTLPPPYNDTSTWPGVLDYISGSINTHMKFSFTHGIVKFRAKTAKEKGIWPAVWLIVPQQYTNVNDTWGPEIDILEMSHLYRDNPNVMGGYIYWTDKNQPQPSFHFKEEDHHLFANFTDNWHDYELRWTEDEIIFIFDNHELLRVNRDDFAGMGNPPHSDWIADVPMYLMINVAVGASWMEQDAMPDENTVFPMRDALLVDYIKVYQKIED